LSEFVHKTVLLAEAVSLLNPVAGKIIVDGTLGGGGHSEALLLAGANVIGIDRDTNALAAAKNRLARFGSQFEAVEGRFSEVIARYSDVHGVLLDLGVSSPQLDVAERGFSFMSNGPLDMRMAQSGDTAETLVKNLTEEELANVIYEFGEERFSRQIARMLKERLPKTTFELAEAVKSAVPKKFWPKETHVATRTFQGLRIAVNRELGELADALTVIPQALKAGGRVGIISFHSLEDRMVKQTFKEWCGEGPDDLPRDFPVANVKPKFFKPVTKKPVTASDEELKMNPRSRSAKLRAVEKLP
jgi:16S rRNA (cytosine1402-N4)-methyltransferase